MESDAKQPGGIFAEKVSFYLHIGLFFTLFAVFVYVFIDPKLIYFSHGKYLRYDVYVPGMTHFESVFTFPGKIHELLAAYFSRFFYFSWAGTLILTILGGLVYLGTDRFIKTIRGRRIQWLCFVPCVLLLIQYAKYYHYMESIIAIVFGLLLFHIYSLAHSKAAPFRVSLFLALGVIGYLICQETAFLFVLLCAFCELARQSYRFTGVPYLLLALLIFAVSSRFVLDLKLLRTLFSIYTLSPSFSFSSCTFPLSESAPFYLTHSDPDTDSHKHHLPVLPIHTDPAEHDT